ncbi:glycosyltransferase [Arthrobacter antioxidans]|uniref:glycosyltransferase n=1 Tax=Arthrobacter antioxidans TaxID=2895818 RepID=UPI001FFE49FF|nr:glycosyltransferase [Arthrobacter antioxidans]
MRLLLATAGSRGDVEPFAALADRALAAGHEVRLVAPENSGVELGDLDTVGMGVDYTRMIEEQGVSVMAALRNYRSVVRPVMRGVIVGSARAALEYEPDLIVYHPKVLSAPLVADALGVPHVMVEIVPALTPTRVFPAAGTVTRGIGPLNRSTYRAAGTASVMFRSELDEVRRIVGGRTRRSSAPAATLMPISPAILRRPHDWPASVHLTGPWTRAHRSATLAPEVARFMADGSFIYAGFGSMAAGDAAARGRTIVDVARARGSRCLVTTGLGGIDVPPNRLGDDVLVARTVSHAAVLPHATAAVHHGGIGTVHAAMIAATPSVIVPFIADQPFWGARLSEAGLAPAPIPQRALTVPALHTALDEAERCRPRVIEVAQVMSTENGTLTALTVLASIR